jgi:nitrate/nitrite transporter NarK
LPIGFVANDVGVIMLIGAAGMVGMGTGNMFALLQRVAPAGEVGLWTGVMNFGGNLSGVVAPIVTGLLIATTHSYYPGFVVAVAVLLCGLPFFGRQMLRDRTETVLSETG